MMNSTGMALFWIWPLLVVVGLVLLGYVLVRARSGTRTGASDAAGRVLDERFARGEIDEQEYHQRRSALEDRAR
ncbi:SHOCT domain-containing protein [Pseudonocardia sp. RS11V-5]|uniref:SHOCT domain-containing protein n=1 Tax=Pseudonocardia terrae TaxID=2905831 RepID=UPI001E5EEC80|nr:SHOCT domain-containing protein [Pseudonocardia terrae]MCE3553168.1 SHOCT domain-containing protein [Pseudonocardia terrae]